MSLHETHPNLLVYVKQMNALAKLFKRKTIDLRHFTEADRKLVKAELAIHRSPENLTCDGELKGVALQKRVAFLNYVEHELEAL